MNTTASGTSGQAKLSVPHDIPPTLTEAALAYAEAGWYIAPLATGSKNPGSLLGSGWPQKTSRDAKILREWFADARAAGLALHVGRSGGVVLDVDHPEKLPERLQEAVEAAPRQSTRRDGSRFHALFSQPAGRRLGNSVGNLERGWGEVRGANGVIVVAPSPHTDPSGEYRWTATGDVPELPGEVAADLPDASVTVRSSSAEELGRLLDEWRVSPEHDQGHAARAIKSKWSKELLTASSRHDLAVKYATWIARDAQAGLLDFRKGYDWLRREFTDVMQDDTLGSGRRTLTPMDAEAELDDIFLWAVAQAKQESQADIAARRSKFRKFTEVSRPEKNLPDEFWAADPALEHIKTAAHSRLVSPDATLACVLARISSYLDPEFRLDTGIAPSGLNFFVSLIGDSSAGKTQAWRCAADLYPDPYVLTSDRDGLALGSGEGLAEVFYDQVPEDTGEVYLSGPRKGLGKTHLVRKRVHRNALFYADEGQQLTKLMDRQGSTLAGELRAAWSGSMLGQTNASADRKRLVPPGTYSVGLVLPLQPALAEPLLADADGGTPQRFLFASAHSEPPREDWDWPGPADFGRDRLPARDMTLPETARKEIKAARLAAMSPDAPPSGLNGHAMMVRAKTAALLGLLAGRIDATDEDWRLAGQLWETSCAVRDGLLAATAEARAKRAAERADEEDRRRVEVAVKSAVESHVAVLVSDENLHARKVERVAQWIAHWLTPGKEATTGAIRRAMSSRDRPYVEDALAYASVKEWITGAQTSRTTVWSLTE